MPRQSEHNSSETSFNIFLIEPPSPETASRRLVQQALAHYPIPYSSITPTFSDGHRHAYLAGEHPYCHHCQGGVTAIKGE